MTHWIKSARLSLATTKMEKVLFHTVIVGSVPFLSPKRKEMRLCIALKYLRLQFDRKLTFKEDAIRTAAKAEKIVSINWLKLNLGGPSESKYKLLANVAMLVLLYEVPIWADTINAKECRRTEVVLVQWKAASRCVQWKAASRCVSAYCTVSTEAVCVLIGILLIEMVADKCKREYSATRWISLGSGKMLLVRFDDRKVTFHKWEERFSGSSKREYNCLLIYNRTVNF